MSAARAESRIQPITYFLVRSIVQTKPGFVQTDELLPLMRRLDG